MEKLKAPTFNSKKELYNLSKSVRNRIQQTIAFIDELMPQYLDIGGENPLKDMIEEKFNIRVNSIFYPTIDFDYDKFPNKKYGTIFCFEILEHLFNPLFFLENMKQALKENGIIYLSTPGKIRLLWDKHHYHEIGDKQIKWLFDRASLEIIKYKKIKIRGFIFQHITGIRPFLRLFFQHTRIYKLRVK